MAIHRLITCIVKHISLSHVQAVSGKTPKTIDDFVLMVKQYFYQ